MSQRSPQQLSSLRYFNGSNGSKSWKIGCLLVLISIVTLTGCTNQAQNPASTIPSNPSPTPLASSPSLDVPSPVATDSAATPSASPSLSNKSEGIRNLESQLKDAVAKSIGVPVDTVECPAQAELKAGDSPEGELRSNRIDCQLSANGQSFVVAVELQGDGSQFQWSTKGLLVLSKLEAFIQSRLQEKSGVEVTAACGDKIRAANPGDTFDCQVKDTQGRSRSVQVTVKDEQGGVDIKLL